MRKENQQLKTILEMARIEKKNHVNDGMYSKMICQTSKNITTIGYYWNIL